MNLIAIDPGETTGWVRIQSLPGTSLKQMEIAKHTNSEWKPTEFGHLDKEEIFDWLKDISAELFVVEDYIVRPRGSRGFDHTWQSPFALQVIGGTKVAAARLDSPVVLQQPSIKPAAAGLTGIPYTKGKKGVHYLDAILHGFYYLIKKEGISPHLLRVPNAKVK